MQALIKALVKARSSFKPIVKDRSNLFHKSKYATLDSVLEAVMEGLTANGLIVFQTTRIIEGRLNLITTLAHESGEMIESFYPLPDISDPQKMGAAITYGRRYSICAVLNVAADEDDDANSVSQGGSGKAVSNQPKSVASAPKFITDEQIKRMMAIANSSGYTQDAIKTLVMSKGFKSRKVITVDAYDSLCEELGNKEQAEIWNAQTQESAA